MILAIVIVIALLCIVVFGPSIWVSRVIDRYSVPADRYSGTGADLARHLLDRHGLHAVTVEPTEHGDHYDPEAKAVRLTEDKFGGRSLTAITVAAHEVGHAVQDHQGRPQHQGQFVDNVMNFLMENVAAAAQQTVPVLHNHGRPAAMMVFDRCGSDNFVNAAQRVEKYRPVVNQLRLWQAIGFKKFLLRQNNSCPCRSGGLPDAA